MVIISVTVCTRSGRALVARQYVPITKVRLETLLSYFPKLIGGDTKQHTYVEADSVRFLYQPIEQLYLVLITNKGSNIVEDLDTLRLLSKVVPDVAGGVTEAAVTHKCFELIFAFDEVLNPGGHRESISVSQIRTNLDMDSHEEKLAGMIRDARIQSANEEMRNKARAIDQSNADYRKTGVRSGSSMPGFGSDDVASGSVRLGASQQQQDDAKSIPSSGSHNELDRAESFPSSSMRHAPTSDVPSSSSSSKSMKLSTKKGSSLMSAVALEDSSLYLSAPIIDSSSDNASSSSSLAAVPVQIQRSRDPVEIELIERLSMQLTRDGSLRRCAIRGSLGLTVNIDSASACQVDLSPLSSSFSYQTHPKVDGNQFNRSSRLTSSAAGSFPIGKSITLLRWTSEPSTLPSNMIPIKVNCWPEEVGTSKINCTIDLTSSWTDITNIEVTIPVPSQPQVVSSSAGSNQFKPDIKRLVWKLTFIDKNASLEFNSNGRDLDVFFPISVNFSSSTLYCPIEIRSVSSSSSSSSSILHSVTKSQSPEEYLIN